MVASKKPEAASNDAVLDTSVDLVAELEEQQAEQAKEAAPAKQDEVVLARGTRLSTNTVYEDRTVNPEVERVVKYQLEEVQLGNGTVLTNVGAEIE